MKKKYFISLIDGYIQGFYSFTPSENYHLHTFKISKELGYKNIAIVKGGYEIMKNDPNLDKEILILDYKNIFNYIYLIFKYSIKGINSVFYFNGHTLYWYIGMILNKIFSFWRCINIFFAHTHPLRGASGYRRFKQFFQDKILFRFFVNRIRLNNITEEYFLIEKKIKKNKLFITPLVVDDKNFYKINNIDSRKDLLVFSQMTRKKNITTIIKAFYILINKYEKYKDLKLHIIGRPNLEYDPNIDIEKFNLQDKVVVKGFISLAKLNQELNQYLICINSSFDEGQCVAVYEAVLSGCALCLPNIISFVDVFKNKALFHNILDVEKLVENIYFYLENKNIIFEYNKKCIEMIKNEYSELKIENKMRKLFQ